MIVTIRGTLGSGAHQIGREVAQLIEGAYVDRQVIEQIASMVGHPVDQIVKKENIRPSLASRVSVALEAAFERTGSTDSAYKRDWKEPLNNDDYLYALKSVVESLALEQSIVIQGRGSQFILKHHPAALHVLVVAPLADRVKRVMISEEVDAGKARKLIKEHDSSRRLFIRRFFQRDIENPDYYDMIINTKTLHFGAAARIIAGAAQEKKSW